MRLSWKRVLFQHVILGPPNQSSFSVDFRKFVEYNFGLALFLSPRDPHLSRCSPVSGVFKLGHRQVSPGGAAKHSFPNSAWKQVLTLRKKFFVSSNAKVYAKQLGEWGGCVNSWESLFSALCSDYCCWGKIDCSTVQLCFMDKEIVKHHSVRQSQCRACINKANYT